MTEKFSAKSILDNAEKEGMNFGGGDWFKFKEGANQVRILTTLEPIPSHYGYGYCVGKEHCPVCKEGGEDKKPSVKFLCWVLDQSDQQMKLAQFPYIVMKTLQDFQNIPDYTFDVVPMPYDLIINATNAGKKEVEYTIMPARKETPVSEEILKQLAKENTPSEIKASMKKKQLKKLGIEMPDDGKPKVADTSIPYPEEDVKPEDIPF